MNCTNFSQQLGSQPSELSEDMHAHMSACSTCQSLHAQLVDFDSVMRAAIEIDVPAGLGKLPNEVLEESLVSDDNIIPLKRKVAPQVPPLAGPKFAIAATLLLGIGVFFGTWLGRITAPLPQSVIAHMEHEPALLGNSWSEVSVAKVAQVLSDGRVSLNGDIGAVRHAGLCSFRGNKVAHLVVQSEHGPVTVMLLPEEKTEHATSFSEEGYTGVLIPVGDGSIAIISSDSQATEEVERNLSDKFVWTI